MDPPPEGCPLCGSTWGDWWEEVDGRPTFFCCELCAKMWKTIRSEVSTRTGWAKIDSVTVEGNRWGRTGLAVAGADAYRFFVVFTPEGALRKFEDRPTVPPAPVTPAAPPSVAPSPAAPRVTAVEVTPPALEVHTIPPQAPVAPTTAPAPAPEPPQAPLPSVAPTPVAPPAPPVTPEGPAPAAEPLESAEVPPAVRERLLDEARRVPDLTRLPVEEGRRFVLELSRETDRLAGAPAPVSQLRTTSFAAGSHRVPVRVYTPVNGNVPLPVVLYYHGGGWVYGDLDTHDSLCREIADRSNCLVISVAYRRAPEAKCPAAFEDAWAALQWVQDPETAHRLELDPARVVVAGDSVGGTLAAAVALKARDARGPFLAGQVLLYPVLDREPATASYREEATGYGLEPGFLRWMWGEYLASPEQASEAYVIPLRATDFKGLPAALVLTAEHDMLRDEAETYADRLGEAGVEVQSTRYAGMVHGFLDYRGLAEEGWTALDEVGAWLARTLHSGETPPPPPPA